MLPFSFHQPGVSRRQHFIALWRSLTANELHHSPPMRNPGSRLRSVHVRSTVLCLTLLVSLAACETSADSLIGIPGGGGITAGQATGNWSFTVQPNSALSCTSGTLAAGQVLTAHLDVLSDGTLTTAASFWQSPSSATERPLTGAVNLTTGFTDLFFVASPGSSAAMELRGTMTSGGTFTGTLTDPAPGSFSVFGACSYTTGGVRTG